MDVLLKFVKVFLVGNTFFWARNLHFVHFRDLNMEYLCLLLHQYRSATTLRPVTGFNVVALYTYIYCVLVVYTVSMECRQKVVRMTLLVLLQFMKARVPMFLADNTVAERLSTVIWLTVLLVIFST